MGMPAAPPHLWTIDEVERLIDERDGYTPRYELVDGALLVTPSPSTRHQRIIGQLYVLLKPYVERHGLGEVRLGPGVVRLTPEAYFEPDLFVVPAENAKRPRASPPVTDLLLAIEVLSPSSVRHDRITKRKFFQRHRVPDYWVVDGDAQAFEVWRPDDHRASLVDEQLEWHPIGAPELFTLNVREFFAEVADDYARLDRHHPRSVVSADGGCAGSAAASDHARARDWRERHERRVHLRTHFVRCCVA
jgi:Uma2 family endonuclease